MKANTLKVARTNWTSSEKPKDNFPKSNSSVGLVQSHAVLVAAFSPLKNK